MHSLPSGLCRILSFDRPPNLEECAINEATKLLWDIHNWGALLLSEAIRPPKLLDAKLFLRMDRCGPTLHFLNLKFP